MSAIPVKLLSCDTHLEHWGTVLENYIPQKHHPLFEQAPYKIKIHGHTPCYGDDGVNVAAIGGYRDYWKIRKGTIDIKKDKIPGTYGGPDEYAEWMKIDGITAAVLLPGGPTGSVIGVARGTLDRAEYLDVLRGYNNFASDFSKAYPDMFLGGACIPTTGIDDAIAELQRVSKLPGIRTVAPAAFPNGSASPQPEDDRFYQEAMNLGMPITMHGGWSSPIGGCKNDQDVAAWIIGHIEVVTGGPYSATQMILSGVFDRLPNLRIIVLEAGAGWLPFSMDVMDHFYDRQRHWAGIDLKNPPSWYCTSGNFLWNVIADRHAIKMRNFIGVDNLSWASDFPHGNSEFPEDRARAMKLVADCTAEERNKILWSNAAQFYGLET
ncbi:amidohydrolase family protein [Steroidobacter denitrificans]|uniref:amidohydrolase family protein n=1 Tax=Steroidobacter denitrificans TaxID=465721 RepID=UPI0009F8A290|nr:amidohydrolase family protein [Steroidobacter denitrificans]